MRTSHARSLVVSILVMGTALLAPACADEDGRSLQNVPAQETASETPDAEETETEEPTLEPEPVPAPAPTPKPECELITPPAAAYLKAGLHPDASNALAYAGIDAAHISQTIGNAAASAGTHGKDGTAGGKDYSAATDLSVRDMSDAEVDALLDKLTSVGFIAYFRQPGKDGWPASEARHVHAIWAGAPMKLSLRNQVRDWRVGKNALASHTTYTFKTWTQCWRDVVWAKYLTANPATN